MEVAVTAASLLALVTAAIGIGLVAVIANFLILNEAVTAAGLTAS